MKLLLSLCILVVATMAEESEVLKSFAKGNSEFSSKFYQEIIKDKQGENIISSPFSAQTILALTTLGTNGNTFTELTQSLHLPTDKEGIKAVYQTLTPKLAGNGEYTLNSANKIYIKKDFEVKKDYKEIATGVFQSDIENIEFEKSAEAADTINKWVESKTNNNIHNLIKPDSLDALTRLVLVNALHFKGNWSHRFEKYATQDKEFFKTEKDVVKVPTMFQTATLKYHECGYLNAKFVELPYEGGDVSMVLIVPNEKEGLAEVEKKGGADLLKYSEEKFKYERIALSMPKFKIETELPLVPTLKNLGVKDVFDAKEADLKGISDAPLYVSDVIQKAFIEVDEDGTEASAATAVKMVLYSLPTMRQPDPMPVKVDRPFVYYLKINDAVIFSGRVITPTTA